MSSLTFFGEPGFSSGIAFHNLRQNAKHIPVCGGVYVVSIPDRYEPDFLRVGTGGQFKQKDPNVSVERLENNWVAQGSVAYIGKAGGQGVASQLRKRLISFLNFGEGQNVSHWGGRFLWQLSRASDLKVHWNVTDDEPIDVKKRMLANFRNEFDQLPFANLTM